MTTVAEALARAERTVMSRLGAGQSLRDAYDLHRWAADIGGVEQSMRVARALADFVHDDDDTRARLDGARQAFARLRELSATRDGGLGGVIVYTLRSRDDVPLYVGISKRDVARLSEHYRDKPWWWRVERIDVERYVERDDALLREAQLIRRLRPLFNVQHSDLTREAWVLTTERKSA